MRVQKWFFAFMFLLLLLTGVEVTSVHASAETTDQTVTFKIKVPDIYADRPLDYIAGNYHYDGQYIFEYPDEKAALENGKYEYYYSVLHANVKVQADYIYLTISKFNWSKTNHFSIVIQTNDFFFPYDITSADFGKTIEVKPDDTYVPVTFDLPYPESYTSPSSLKFCFTDSKAIPTHCFVDMLHSFKVPAGRYNIQVSGSTDRAGYGLLKTNYPLTQKDSTVHFSNNNLAKVTIQMKDSQNRLKPTNVRFQMASAIDAFNSVAVINDVLFVTKANYDQIEVEFTNNDWKYRYIAKQKSITQDTQLVFDSDLSVKIIMDAFDSDSTYQQSEFITIQDGLGQKVDNIYKYGSYGSIPIDVQLEKVDTQKNYDNLMVNHYLHTPNVTGDFDMTVSIPQSPIPVKSASTHVHLQEPEWKKYLDQTNVDIYPILNASQTFSIKAEDIKKVKDNSWVSIHLEDQTADDLIVHLTADEIDHLIETASDLSLITSYGVLSLPVPAFSGEEDVTIEVNQLASVEGAVSPVMYFQINQGTQELNTFTEDVSVTLYVDPSTIEDQYANDIYYYNMDTKKWETTDGFYVKNGTFLTTVHRTGIYSAFNNYKLAKGTPVITHHLPSPPETLSVTPVLKEGKFLVDADDLSKLKDGSKVKIDLTTHEVKDSVVHLVQDQMELLVRSQSDITVETKQATVTFPYQLFSGTEGVELEVNQLASVDGVVTPVMDFSLKQGSTSLHQFDLPVTISLKVPDLSKVKDPDQLRIFYYNTETKQWELVGGEYSNGFVTAETSHFSIYSTFSTDTSKKGTPVGTESDLNSTPSATSTDHTTDQQDSGQTADNSEQTQTENEDSNSDSTISGETNNQQNTSTTHDDSEQVSLGEENSTSSLTEQPSSDVQNQEESQNQIDDSEQAAVSIDDLPEDQTTSIYIWLLFVGVLVILGATFVIYNKRKQHD